MRNHGTLPYELYFPSRKNFYIEFSNEFICSGKQPLTSKPKSKKTKFVESSSSQDQKEKKESKKQGEAEQAPPKKDNYKIPKKRKSKEDDSQEKGTRSCDKFLSEEFLHIVEKLTKLTHVTDIVLNKSSIDLIAMSKTSNSWKKNFSAWNAFSKFEQEHVKEFVWPLESSVITDFVIWCVSKNSLAPTTAKAYVSSIKLVHDILDLAFKGGDCKSKIAMLMKGADNIQKLVKIPSNERCSVTINMMNLLSHEICCANWSDVSKQVIWTACTTGFFGTVRMGEILSPNSKNFDRNTTFCWKNVIFKDNSEVILRIPFSKSTGLSGKIVCLFKCSKLSFCPVESLIKLRKMYEKDNVMCPDKPVFMFSSGKFLTTEKLNKVLDSLLAKHLPQGVKISGHSFRAAIPTAVATHPNKVTTEELKQWGKWESDSYKLYTKNDYSSMRKLFSQVENILYDSL